MLIGSPSTTLPGTVVALVGPVVREERQVRAAKDVELVTEHAEHRQVDGAARLLFQGLLDGRFDLG